MTANDTAAAGSAAACDGLIRAKSACLGPEGWAGRHQAGGPSTSWTSIIIICWLSTTGRASSLSTPIHRGWQTLGHRSTPGTGRRHADAEIPALITEYCDKGGSVAERSVPELISVLGSLAVLGTWVINPAVGWMNEWMNEYFNGKSTGQDGHKTTYTCPHLPLLSSRPAVTPATLKKAAASFAAWWTEARWVWTVCLRLLPDSVAAAIWTQALLRLSPAR